MERFLALGDIPAGFGPSAVTIGKFDGVHRGHRAVIGSLVRAAEQRGIESVVVTFDRNPLSLLAPASCPPPLVSNDQKLDLLESAGVDATLMLTFDGALSAVPAEDFVTSILVDRLRAAEVLVGSDFRFGARGAGSVELLREMGAVHGFVVTVVDDLEQDGARRVSSTWIREALDAGDVRLATELLGEPPTIRSVVVHGLQRGRALGYPTANLSPAIQGFIPADGVYAAWLTADGVRYPAAVSIGNNPTFEGVPEKQVEAHVIDEDLDLYDRVVSLSFVEYIRGMRKFSGADALAEQMGADELQIRDVLGVPRR